MGEAFQNLREQGKGVVVDRQENILIECNENNSLKKKTIITRERFSNIHQNSTSAIEQHKPNTIKNNNNNNAISDNDNKHKNNNIISNHYENNNHNNHYPDRRGRHKLKSKNHTIPTRRDAQEVIANTLRAPSQSLGSSEVICLKHDIDAEIEHLKRQRQRLLEQPHHVAEKYEKIKERQRPAVHEEKTWDQNFISNKAKPKKHIECRYERVVSTHRLHGPRRCKECSCACRPRMRTIGLQKGQCCPTLEKYLNLKEFSITNLKLNYNPVSEVIPTAYGCFDYAPNSAFNDYYNSSANSCSGTYCHPYTATCGNSNRGGVCTQETHCVSSRMPCSDYNYCCDTYYYNCPNSMKSCCWRRKTCTPDGCRRCSVHSYDYRRQKTDLSVEETAHERRKEKLERDAAREKASRLRSQSRGNGDKRRAPERVEESAARIAAQLLGDKGRPGGTPTATSDSDGRSYRKKKNKYKSTKETSNVVRNPPAVESETERTVEQINVNQHAPHHKRDKDNGDEEKESATDDKKEKRYEEYINKYQQSSSCPLTEKADKGKTRPGRMENVPSKPAPKPNEEEASAGSRSQRKSAGKSSSPSEIPTPREDAPSEKPSATSCEECFRDCANQTVNDQCTQFGTMVDASAACDGEFDEPLTLHDRLAIRNAFLTPSRENQNQNHRVHECRTTQTTRCEEYLQLPTCQSSESSAEGNSARYQRDGSQEILRRLEEICGPGRISRPTARQETCCPVNSCSCSSAADSRSCCSPVERIAGEEILRRIKERHTENSRNGAATISAAQSKALHAISCKSNTRWTNRDPQIPRPMNNTREPDMWNAEQQVECMKTTSSELISQGSSAQFKSHIKWKCTTSSVRPEQNSWADLLAPPNRDQTPDQSRTDCYCRSFSAPKKDSKPLSDSKKNSRLNSAPGEDGQSLSPQQKQSEHMSRSRERVQNQGDIQEQDLRRCDLEARLRFCEEVCQQAALLRQGGGSRHRSNSMERIIKQYSSRDECRSAKVTQERFSRQKPFQEQGEEEQPSSGMLPSQYVTASSNYSFAASYGSNDDCESRYRRIPLRRRSRMRIDPVPEYTGCQCMLNTYLDILSAVSQTNKDGICGGARPSGSSGIGSGMGFGSDGGSGSGSGSGIGGGGGGGSGISSRSPMGTVRSKSKSRTCCEKKITFRRY